MTALPLRDFTAAEQAKLAAIEAAPAAAESFDPDAERLARLFHESYERLAPTFSYETRHASAVAWEDVPAANRALMCATVPEVLAVLSGPSSDAERAVERVLKCTYASDDGSEYEHDHGIGDGYPECPACWAEDIRRAVRGD